MAAARRNSGTASSEHAGGAVLPVSLPLLGVTWVDRGFGYLARRSLLGVCVVGYFAAATAIGTVLYLGFVSSFPAPARVALHVLEGVAAVVALVAGWRRQRRDGRTPVDPASVAEQQARTRRVREGGMGAAGFLALLAPAVPALAALGLGAAVAAAVAHETPRELGARADYERRLTEAAHEAHRADVRRAPRNGPSWR